MPEHNSDGMPFVLHSDLQRDGILLGSFPLSLLLLINDSNYPWFVLVPQRAAIVDAIDLTEEDYFQLATESRVLGACIRELFSATKINVAALGNMTPQLHVHHIVRFPDDAAWPGPIWGAVPLKPYGEDAVKSIRVNIASARMPGFTHR